MKPLSQLALIKSVRKTFAPKVQVVPALKGRGYKRPQNNKEINVQD